MKLIEPCCAGRHMMGLRRALGSGGTLAFEGYGDLSLTELLPAILTRYSETRLVIMAPSLPEQAADIISKWMDKQWARMDGQGKLDAVSHLTIVTDVEQSPAVEQWLGTDRFGKRLTVTDRVQDETMILLPDFAVTGPVNMRYGEHFTAEATNETEKVKALWEKFAPEPEEKPGDKPEERVGDDPDEKPGEKTGEKKPAPKPKARKDPRKKEEPEKKEGPATAETPSEEDNKEDTE